MNRDTAADLQRWLDSATHGLPSDVSQLVRAEIEAHYEDARHDHERLGLSRLEAHRAAMVELGDDKTTSLALHDTYLAERRYLKACVASMIPSLSLVALLIGFQLSGSLNSFLLQSPLFSAMLNLATLFSTLYVLGTFKLLLAGRFHFYQIDRPITIIKWSLVTVVIASLASHVLINRQIVILMNDPLLLPTQTTDGAHNELLNLVIVVAMFMTGLGWMLFSDKLIRVEDHLLGIITPLRYVLLVNGVALASIALAMLFGVQTMILLALFVVAIVGTVKCAAWSLLFFRAAHRGSDPPIQTA